LRDNNGIQESHVIDLTQTDVLDSDLYYLQQNDVLVVNPNDTQVAGSVFNRNNGLYVSIASLLLSVIILIAR
jgi:polysaccharide export outer membrane protein